MEHQNPLHWNKHYNTYVPMESWQLSHLTTWRATCSCADLTFTWQLRQKHRFLKLSESIDEGRSWQIASEAKIKRLLLCGWSSGYISFALHLSTCEKKNTNRRSYSRLRSWTPAWKFAVYKYVYLCNRQALCMKLHRKSDIQIYNQSERRALRPILDYSQTTREVIVSGLFFFSFDLVLKKESPIAG